MPDIFIIVDVSPLQRDSAALESVTVLSGKQ